MAFKVEITHAGRTLVMPPFKHASDVTLQAIESFARVSFGFRAFVVRYIDDEQDACTLTVMSLPDALDIARSAGKLVLEIAPQAGDHGDTAAAREDDASVLELDDDRDWELVKAPETSCSSEPETSQQDAGEPQSWSTRLGSLFGLGSSVTSAEAVNISSEVEAQESRPTPVASQDGTSSSPEQVEETTLAVREAMDSPSQELVDDASHDIGESERGKDERRNLSDADKVSFILAAFDVDGDGRLNFEEFAALNDAAGCGELFVFDFGELCTRVSAEAERGLGKDHLRQLYSEGRSLENDFKASIDVLQRARDRETRDEPLLRRLLPVLALPLAVGYPLIGLPALGLALGAANSSSVQPSSP